MIKHKYIDKICIAVMLAAVLLTVVFMCGESWGLEKSYAHPAYEKMLFDDSRVHEIDIQIDDWEKFLETAPEEEYSAVTLVIDGEAFEHAGLRAKGNNSRKLVEKYGHDRYSLKIEMDHYIDGGNYYGLDKFSLDSSFQDNSYLKSWLAYDMMRFMEVPSPLCSYVWVTVNGKPWGLFLAVEEPEEAFVKRNFGMNGGRLYKPDYKNVNHENLDVGLNYIDDNPKSYDNIFRKAKFKTAEDDMRRVINALEILDKAGDTSGMESAEREDFLKELEAVIDVDEVLRYFTVQTFVVNLDSYLGRTGHNYFLYEEGGRLQILPWDYNLAFGTYSLGMPDPINDSELYINYPVDTPASGEIMTRRPLFHHIMMQKEYFDRYHEYYRMFIDGYFESGLFEQRVSKAVNMISPYVKKDPTAFISYDDYLTGVETINEFCRLRARSVDLQLKGIIPSTIKGQSAEGGKENFIPGDTVWLPDMGQIADLKDGVH